MKTPSTDLRVLKTREAIKSHFLDLLLHKSFTDITVKDIADTARIGRGTFYLHYKDKFDLLDQVIDEGLADVLKLFKPSSYFRDGRVDLDKAREYALTVFEHFKNNEHFFRAMFFNEGVPFFRSRMQQAFIHKFTVEMRGKIAEIKRKQGVGDSEQLIDIEIAPIFISSGMLSLIEWWFKKGMPIPGEKMADKALRLLAGGPISLLGLKIEKGERFRS